MKLIVGLGNPGQQYSRTRHNIGWSVIDAYARHYEGKFVSKPRWKAEVCALTVEGKDVLLIKPATYYNLSGEAVQAIKTFYKLSQSDILLIHDELALPIGTIRTRQGGSDAGNNGVKSISGCIGEDTYRLRIGSRGESHDSRTASDYVLQPLNAAEQSLLHELQPVIRSLIDAFIKNELQPGTHTCHTSGSS